MRRIAMSLALVALATGTAEAQMQTGRFTVTTRVGAMTPERAASIDAGGTVGLDTEYSLNKYFGVGAVVDVARANTRREDFVARLRYGNAAVGGGDSIYYQYLSQPVTTLNLGLMGVARMPLGKMAPFLMAGVGNYTQFLDVHVTGASRRQNDLSYTFGAGAWFRLTEAAGIQLDVRSITFRNVDRKFLDPSSGALPNNVFPEDFPSIPAAKNTAQNTVITLGFRYIPGAGGDN